jgi:transcriptional regulator with XRE-family HTH domain
MIDTRMKINKARFGKFIAERREVIYGPQSQSLLADKLHIAGPTMTNIEGGKRMPSFDLFIDLADKLQMTPGELIMIMAEREPPKAGYMEMNDWLYERLLRIIKEYQELTKMTPEQTAAFNARLEAQIKEADILANMTPNVDQDSEQVDVEKQEPSNVTIQNSTENS